MGNTRRQLHEMRKCAGTMASPHPVVEDKIEIPCLEESLEAVKILCKKVTPRWTHVPIDSLRVDKISGGITNILFSVVPTDLEEEEPVVVRIFGPMTEMVIDRQRELLTVQALSDAGFGPRLLASFANGVVQSFIHADTLTTEEMSCESMVPLIASTLARFHALKVPGPREPQLWPTLHKYLDVAQDLHSQDEATRAQSVEVDFGTLRNDVKYAMDLTVGLESPVVFSHNDLLSGNLMYNRKKGQLHLIDFEYSAYGYRGYDIANHFCEYAGFECDYSRFPNQAVQILFFRHYLNPENPEKVKAAEIVQLAEEVSAYTLASHLFWAVWALIQARFSPIDFDYMNYFQQRYSEFMRLQRQFKKEELTS